MHPKGLKSRLLKKLNHQGPFSYLHQQLVSL